MMAVGAILVLLGVGIGSVNIFTVALFYSGIGLALVGGGRQRQRRKETPWASPAMRRMLRAKARTPEE